MYRSILGGEGCVERNDIPAPHGEVCEQDKEFLRQMREDAKSPGFKHKSKCEEVLEENMPKDTTKDMSPRTGHRVLERIDPRFRVDVENIGNEGLIDSFGPSKSKDLPDSGKRREFSTGSVRDDRSGKGRYDLLSPIITKADAILMEKGAKKYKDWNWTKGQPIMSYIDSAKRHLDRYVEDLLMGRESEECHLSACRWNVGAVIHTLHMIENGLLPKELDDRPSPHPKIKGMTYNERESNIIGGKCNEPEKT